MWKINPVHRSAFNTAVCYGHLTGRLIKNQSDILAAFLDIYKYRRKVFGGHFCKPKGSTDIRFYNSILNKYANVIWEYFNAKPNTVNNQNSFDGFHERICSDLQADFDVERRKHGCLLSFSYGHAQKMINMVFKYLSCYDDYDDFADLFSYCHIPIDSYILDILNNAFHVPSIVGHTYMGLNWTSFTISEYRNIVREYRAAMRGLIGAHPWLTIDFLYWGAVPPFAPLPVTGIPVIPIPQFHT